MKKQIVYIALSGIFILLFQSFMSLSHSQKEIPEEVETILKSSCYNCHFTGAKAEKALEKVNFEQWDNYKLIKKIELLGDIDKMLEEGKMPPEKYLEHNPDKQLSEEQVKLIVDWTRQKSDELMQGN
jgi:hypothetical protein